MNPSRVFLIIVVFCGTFLSANLSAFAQTPSDCNSNEDDNIAAVYNFVPEDALLPDFRRLSKTEEGFVNALRQNPNIFVEDHTTQILSEEMMPEMPPISDQLVPSPAESGANFYFNGKITKTNSGLLLTVDLRKPSDNSLLNEVKTPFADAAGAENAGTTAAAQMLSFLVTQTQTSRANRATSNYIIKPKIIFQVDKLRIKPNEPDPAKILLTDCDGTPLKNRQFEIQTNLSQSGNVLDEHLVTRTTDDKGMYSGPYIAKVPGILTSIVRLKYTDLQGKPQEAAESVSIVVSGGEPDLWQMSVTWQYSERDRYLNKDLQAHRTAIASTLIGRKGNLLFTFKVPTSPEGDIFTNEFKSFNGFAEAVFRSSEINHDNESLKIYAHGTLDQKQEAIQNIQAGFSIDPGNKSFKFNLSNLLFRGQRDSLACSEGNGCQIKHDEYVVSSDGSDKLSGEIPITPEMIRSGIYTFNFQETKQVPVNHTKNDISDQTNEGSYVFNQIEIKVSRVNPVQGKVIN